MKWATLTVAILFFSAFFAPATSAEVYFLKDGTCISGTEPTPLDDTFLSLQTLKGQAEIDRGEILICRGDVELRECYKKTLAGLEPGNLREAGKLAWWCRRKGLYTEMFGLLDTIFAADPKNRDLLGFVNEMVTSIDFGSFQARASLTPDSARKLLLASAKTGPTLTRIGEEILAALPDPLLTPVLLKELKSRKKNVQAVSLRVLGLTRPESALEPLIGAALFDGSKGTRELSLNALALYDDSRIVHPFLAGLRLNRSQFRLNAIEGLSRLADARVSGALIAALAPQKRTGSSSGTRAHIYSGTQTAAVTGFDPEVATAAVAASPIVTILQDGVTLDIKVFGAAIYQTTTLERRKIGGLLKKLNGIDYGTDFALWKEWWDRNRTRMLAKKGS
jgi:hypothetical protein